MASSSLVTRLKPFLTGVGILAIGAGGLLILIALRADPPREEREEFVPVVQVMIAEQSSGVITVSGSGNVRSVRESQLSVEVAGQIVAVSDQFVAGGLFRKGDELFRIDSHQYENAVTVARAEVIQRAYEVIIAREESHIARDEWELLKKRDPDLKEPEAGELGSLVFKEPQVALAEAAAEAAKARLADAQRRLDRSSVKAPYDGRIQEKTTELGQYVVPGQAVASFYSTDAVEIMVPLAADQASLIENVYSPRRPNRTEARVQTTIAGRLYTWTGHVARTEGALDLKTRTLRLVVRVSNPYSPSGNSPPLMIGTYVDVVIDARQVDSYVEIPNLAVREGDIVWVVRNGALTFRHVEILTRQGGSAIVTSGLQSGDEVVISSLSVVSENMRVRSATAN